MGWNKVTRPIEESGLGIQTAKGRNLVYLAKLNWRFNTEKEALWAQILKKKYMSPRRINSRNEKVLLSSKTWKAIKVDKEIFSKGTRWSLRHDSNFKFWLDTWISKGPLRDFIYRPLSRGEEDFSVGDVASAIRWHWRRISMILPPTVYMEIQAMPQACVANEEDHLIWAASSNGNFNRNSAYLLIVQFENSMATFNGKWIWKLNTLPRVQSFIWMCYHRSIATCECLASRGIQVDIYCPLCHQAPETIIHILKDCSLASRCWQVLGEGDLPSDFFSMDLRKWLDDNCNTTKHSHLQSLP